MTATGSTVERLRRKNLRLGGLSWDDAEALLAVVDAAQEYDEASSLGPPFSVKRSTIIRQARQRLHDKLAALHSQASDEGKA